MRLLNGCDKIPTEACPTLSVHIADSGRFVLSYNPKFCSSISAKKLKLALVHEAGHIALRHQERLFRLLAQVGNNPAMKQAILAVFNIAADVAVNDTIVRREKEFIHCWTNKELDWFFPETFTPQLPAGKSFEDYVNLLAKVAKQVAKTMKKAACDRCGAPSEGSSGYPGETGEGDDDPGETELDSSVSELAKDPVLVQAIIDGFAKISGHAHDKWVEQAMNASADEAVAMADRLKRHTKQLARSAYEQSAKSRGSVPGYIKGLIKGLLRDDQVPWYWFFASVLQDQVSSKITESMSMPNVSTINDMDIEPWPGYSLDKAFNVIFVVDTSGSMSDKEVQRGFALFNSLMASDTSIHARFLQCDANIQAEVETSNYAGPIESDADSYRYGYGGTTYVPAFKRILGIDGPEDWMKAAVRCDDVPSKPNLVIVVTDGYVQIEDELLPKYHPGCPIIWLVTPHGTTSTAGMSASAPDFVIHMKDMVEEAL